MDRGVLAMTPIVPQLQAETATPLSGSAEELSDAEVMLRVKAGDDAAFPFLVQKYRRPMINFMYRMTRNTAAAEDLAQEVFLRVYRSRSGYEASAKFTTWLYRIATNLAVNHARDTRHERPDVTLRLDEPFGRREPFGAQEVGIVEPRLITRAGIAENGDDGLAWPGRPRLDNVEAIFGVDAG